MQQDSHPIVEWCRLHGCTHAHCPRGCDKPQPAIREGVLYCSRCLVYEGIRSVMVPCTPTICPDDPIPS
jgi:hypothetical protein